MQVLTFLIVLLIPTIVSTTKCKNPALKCIELCCETTQFYDDLLQMCMDIPDDTKDSWLAFCHGNERMEFVEYGKCEGFFARHESIPSCYSPYYPAESNQHYLKEFTDVRCDRFKETPHIGWRIILLVCVVSQPICLPIMIVYTCRQSSRQKFTFKLVSWYFQSEVAYFVVLFMFYLHFRLLKGSREADLKIHLCIYVFFFVSSYLWLNVIGFQIWLGYTAASEQNNSDKDHRRFVCFSIFVWGTAAAITGTYFLLSKTNAFYKAVAAIGNAIPFFNLLTFLILSVNICMIRWRVVNLTNEVHFKRNLVTIVLHLGLMMGFPRMFIVILSLFVKVDKHVFALFLLLEPYVVFTVLVWKPKNYLNCSFLCCCCRKSVEIPKAAEVV